MITYVRTNEEYKAQGFRPYEIPMIRRHDELFGLWKIGVITEEEKEEMFTLQAELEL